MKMSRLFMIAVVFLNSCKRENAEINNSADSVLSAYPEGGYLGSRQLNDRERALYNQNPAAGRKAIAAAVDAHSRAATFYPKDSQYQGTGDAYRHSLWNYNMCASIGCDAAKQWADAHEDGGQTVDNKMDYHNNQKGREIFMRGGAEFEVQRSIQYGEMIIINQGEQYPSNREFN